MQLRRENLGEVDTVGSESALFDCLRLLLRPIVRFCLRSSLGLNELIEAAKVIFIEVAAGEMEATEKKINISRLSAITGVHRKDAVRIYREKEFYQEPTRFSSRVIGQWRQDSRFLSASNRPRPLSYRGEDSEFAKLVALVSKDLHPGTILFDLERIGAVKRVGDQLKLVARAYVPKGNPREGFRMMSEDSEDLMMAVMDNIFTNEGELPNYHAKAHYDNISEDDLPSIRAWLFKQSSSLHQKAAKYLSKYDLDINPNTKKKGGKRVAFGIFSKT